VKHRIEVLLVSGAITAMEGFAIPGEHLVLRDCCAVDMGNAFIIGLGELSPQDRREILDSIGRFRRQIF